MKITVGIPLLAAALTVLQVQATVSDVSAASRQGQAVALTALETVETAYLDLNTYRPDGRAAATADDSSNSYKVTKMKGRLTGVEVRVSGLGGWARLHGSMTTSSMVLDRSTTYERIKNTYNIEAGVGGFYAFLAGGIRTKAERENVKETMKELTNQLASNATVEVDLMASGYAPNVAVTASAYVTALQIEDESGNKFTVLSDGDPQADVFPGDASQGGAQLPERENDSSITFS